MSKVFFIPYEEKLGSIRLAIDTLQQVLAACLEYRNLAIDKGATKEELETALCYFDKEEFGSTIEMALKNLEYLYLNTLAESSEQPKEKKATQKEELPKVIIGTTLAPTDIDYSLTPQNHVPQQYRRFFIDRFINDNWVFPADISKERISNMDYADFLKTPYWKAIALYVKEKAGKKCSVCGATKTLEVHHLTYDNHGDELHHLDDLTCICRKCHEKLHSK